MTYCVVITTIITSNKIARIQECHILIGHIICEIVEKNIFGNYENERIKISVSYTDYDGNDEVLEYLSTNVGITDIIAPTLQAVTQVATPSDDPTPTFVFSSNEAGTITSNKSFSTTTTAIKKRRRKREEQLSTLEDQRSG